jgi:hypothetical protein
MTSTFAKTEKPTLPSVDLSDEEAALMASTDNVRP